MNKIIGKLCLVAELKIGDGYINFDALSVDNKAVLIGCYDNHLTIEVVGEWTLNAFYKDIDISCFTYDKEFNSIRISHQYMHIDIDVKKQKE